VGLLAAVHHAVTRGLDFRERKIPVLGLGFLQANDVGLNAPEPVEQVRQAHLQRVDIPARELQAVMPLWRSRASTLGSRPRKARNDSAAGRLPPTASTSSRKRAPTFASRMPFSS